jgi:GTPase SAR1 family protein
MMIHETMTAPSATTSSHETFPWYGQIIVGPPGSGKTTYCAGMQQYLRLLGRNAWVINLDPANEGYADEHHDEHQKDEGSSNNTPSLPYETLVDIRTDLVDLGSVQEQLDLGPNGGLLYCMEYLEAHIDEFIAIIEERAAAKVFSQQQDESTSLYLLIDCPGQVELFTHNDCIPHVIQKMTKRLNLRLAAVQLIDSQYITDASKFLSAALVSTMTLIRLELPMISVLSKVDLLSTMVGDDTNALPLSLDFFTDCPDMTKLLPLLETGQSIGDSYTAINDYHESTYADDPDYQRARAKVRRSAFYHRYYKMHQALAEVVDDYALLSFVPCDIQKAESVGRVLARIDQSICFVAASSSGNSLTQEELFQCAAQAESSASKYEVIADIQERMSMQQLERQNGGDTGKESESRTTMIQ